MARKRIQGSGSPRTAGTRRVLVGSSSSRSTAGAIRRTPITTTTFKSALKPPAHRGIKMPGYQAPDTVGPNY